MRFLPLLAATLLGLSACGSATQSACNRALECCSTMAICEDINSTGPNWVDRCQIEQQAVLDTLGTYKSEACNKIISTREDLLDCLGGAACTDIANAPRTGYVAKCAGQAQAYCAALQASGDACGHDYSGRKCDDPSDYANLAFE